MVLPWSVSIHPFEQEVQILIPRRDFKSLFNFCPFCGSVLMETGGGGGGGGGNEHTIGLRFVSLSTTNIR